MGFCVHCQKESKNKKFCDACGRQLVQENDLVETKKDAPFPKESSTKAMMAHLIPLVALALGILGLFAGIFYPPLFLLLWTPGFLIRFSSSRNPYTKEQATESLNFQILMCLVYLISFILFATRGQYQAIVALVILYSAMCVSLIFTITATLATARGKRFTYPVKIRFLK